MASDTNNVLPIRIVVDYATVKGKRSVCHLSSCNKVIERGHLRVKEEYTTPPIEGGEAALKYHIECYSSPIDMNKLEGLDKLKEKDKKTILAKATTGSSENENKAENKGSEVLEEEKTENKQETEAPPTTTTTTTTESNEKQLEESKEEKHEEEKQKEEPEKEKEAENVEKEKPQQAPMYRNGSKVMAKVRANVSKNIWFAAKVLNSRQNSLGIREYHVNYTDENVKDLKEWVAEKFVTPPINQDSPAPATSLVPGTLGLGWRRKPGSQADWWYSVKVLRYLNDVPGAYVQWMDFPFPDSILESGKVFPLKGPEPQQTGSSLKRQLGESENDTLANKKEKVT